MGLRGTLKVILVLIIAAWLISPIPEVTLILGLATSWVLFKSYSIGAIFLGTAFLMIPIYGFSHFLESRYDIEERTIVWIRETDSEVLQHVQSRFIQSEDSSSDTNR